MHDRGLGAHPPAGGERIGKQAIERGAAGARSLRQLVGAAHLPEDLSLAEHHRIEARRHAEQVAGHLVVLKREEHIFQIVGAHATAASQHLHKPPAGLLTARGEHRDLSAVAGGDGDELMDRAGASGELGEHMPRTIIRSARRSRSATGAVRCETPTVSSWVMRRPPILIGGVLTAQLLHLRLQLIGLAHQPGELASHDRHVHDREHEEHQVGGDHVRAASVAGDGVGLGKNHG